MNTIQTKASATLRKLFGGKATATCSVVINKPPQDLYGFLENIDNWVLFSFHGVFEVQQQFGIHKVLSVWGPGTISLSKSERHGILDHVVNLYYEDHWNVFMRITPHAKGSYVNFSVEKPLTMPAIYFNERVRKIEEQLSKTSGILRVANLLVFEPAESD
ncbi:MAG: hypothetical protein HC859_03740 [Bacteroidia bacterium]|nr:hypothetical protein [Bacteroidia bacterium]